MFDWNNIQHVNNVWPFNSNTHIRQFTWLHQGLWSETGVIYRTESFNVLINYDNIDLTILGG